MEYSTKTLAQGCFGKIYKEKFGDGWAAIKRVPELHIKKADMDRECEVFNNARHPNVVRLLGDPWVKDSKWHIPMEFISGEDLETTIFESANSKILLTPAVKATIIIGMCEGLHHLHSKDIVHQDLKPDNIMVEDETHRAVIIDLGPAKFCKDGLSSAINLGNEAYSAPEILQRNGVRDKRSDVWAMGKIIAELCARVRLPTQYLCASKIQETLKTDQAYCTPVSKMVETNPDYRVNMDQILPDIRKAASALLMDSKPRDFTVPQRNEMRGNAMDAVFPDIRRSVFASHMDIRDGTATQRYAMMGNAMDETFHNMRTSALAQHMDIRDEMQRHQMMLNQSLGLRRSPMLNVQHEPFQQWGMGRAADFAVRGDGVINQMSHMSMTGEVSHQSFKEEKVAMKYEKVQSSGGTSFSYNKVHTSKQFSEKW
ncbi:uncharacterized protein [Paramisgurnus dabryanus]|uniref:uncharacterized protein n=1 Tax=Paramisgurnus dabryanus TaxID=90735 RepID=UPI0031F3AF2C